VKVFEKGGAMYTGKIVQTYRQGQEIDVKVMVSLIKINQYQKKLISIFLIIVNS
jgi:hypothetical protein